MPQCSDHLVHERLPQGLYLSAKVLGESHSTTVLFLSGFVGSSEVWDTHFQELAKQYRLIMLDTLGFGRSPKPDIEYSLDQHLEAIDRTLDHYAVLRAHIVGHSMGCLLALAYANRYPGKIGRLALLACPAFDDEQQARRAIGTASLFNRWLAMDTAAARWACALMCTLRPVLLPLAPYLVRHVPAVVAKDALRHNWQSYSRTLRNVIFQADTHRWMQQIAAPVLLIHGTRDKTAPYDNVQRYTQLPNVHLLTLEADHGLIFTHSRLIASELAQFLALRGSGMD
jgi:pimeloyl-ACP methyl ester carboxylesterase